MFSINRFAGEPAPAQETPTFDSFRKAGEWYKKKRARKDALFGYDSAAHVPLEPSGLSVTTWPCWLSPVP
jgi:hypothetical protein